LKEKYLLLKEMRGSRKPALKIFKSNIGRGWCREKYQGIGLLDLPMSFFRFYLNFLDAKNPIEPVIQL
jgi:hypothetical protein